MLPKEEKIQSNKLIGRLYKQSKNKNNSLRPKPHNESYTSVLQPP